MNRAAMDTLFPGVRHPAWLYSVCFSPDNSKLYFTANTGILQLDLTLSNTQDITSSVKLVTGTGSGTFYDTSFIAPASNPSIKLGKDGKIYFPTNKIDTVAPGFVAPILGCIQNPNLLEQNCDYDSNAVQLASMPDTLWKRFFINIRLTGIEGKEIKYFRNPDYISTTELANGIYFLHIMNKNGRLIKIEKIVKQ